MNGFNDKFTKNMEEIAKNIAEAGKETAQETAGAAADVLKTLAKELGVIGEKLEKWVETNANAKKDPNAQPPQS